MEHNVRVLPPEVLMKQLLGLLDETESVPLIISGNSMSPFLVHGRDTVFLSKVNRPLKKGDMILYQRDSGTYILHRICRIQDNAYFLAGDAQPVIEQGIRREQVRAVVVAVRRKGKLLRKGSFWWDFFEKVWIRLIPVRPQLVRCYSFLRGGRNGESTND